MARTKITEYKAKELIYKDLNISYEITSYNTLQDKPEKIKKLDAKQKYVLKVDQGIKGRFKKGLVALDVSPKQILLKINSMGKLGYKNFLVESFLDYDSKDEHYFSIERTRDGKKILYSKYGGINIEQKQNEISDITLSSDADLSSISRVLKIDKKVLETIIKAFDKYYFSFLEINPLVTNENNFYILDLAVEVDSTAEFFVEKAWSSSDFVSGAKLLTKEEEEVLDLSGKSQAAFKLDLINPDGTIFMLLSGGGASIVLADEVYNQGYSNLLANYGEYSGNPNQEETYIYTKNLLSLLIKSKAHKKVLIIGGGVANFTDIRITFKGIITALDEVKEQLKKQQVKVFVRRGGPYQKEGLELMENFLKKEDLFGIVKDPKMVLTEIVILALQYLKK